MKRSTLVFSSLAVAVIAAQGWWIVSHHTSAAPDASSAMPAAMPMERKPLYWYDPMKPEAHFDKPGKSPFMDMDLVPMYAEAQAPAMKSAPAERKPIYWYDPMKPEAHFDKPGRSPFMDMDLVPMYADEARDTGTSAASDAPANAGVVRIDPQVVQNFGVRTAQVTRIGGSAAGLRASGSVQVDEDRIVAIESRTAGWVEKLRVKAVGDSIQRGQSVAGLYSPDLYASQQELALALRMQDERLVEAARQRLLLQGLSPAQLATLDKGGAARQRIAIVAPQNGVVTELNVREGQQVTPGMPLMRVADLSTVWIVIEVPESQSAGLRAGQSGEARFNALPGVVLKGKLEYVYPGLDTLARTVRARMRFENRGLMLKPGMYAEVTLAGDDTHQECLSVPSEAVIRTGGRDVVILSLGQGRFRPAVVRLGEDRNGQTEILSGLDEGETVVVSGQFLIDSEANLRGALARMNDAEEQP
ncbi:MAG: efflux RND transporter periplasmic adaptor subunit [Rhizobium sp.]|nr:MAG: efflux RND transporter periplasmic adaptor subunit [Rhizobium sp.]